VTGREALTNGALGDQMQRSLKRAYSTPDFALATPMLLGAAMRAQQAE
jgi:hypothetical protein